MERKSSPSHISVSLQQAESGNLPLVMGGTTHQLTDAETQEVRWYGAAVYLRGKLVGYAPVRWATWGEHLASIADLAELCTFRHFRFSGSTWEVVTQPKGNDL